MLPLLEETFKKSPFLRKAAKRLLGMFGITYVPLQKRRILDSAREKCRENLPLDVSIRYGYKIFHNPGNSLINRGPAFESEVQSVIQTLLFLDRQRGNSPTFADIGANIGLHSLAVKENFPKTPIIAFDPSPFSWKYFEITIRENGIKGIELIPFALGSEEGTVDFYTWGENSSGDSLHDTGRQPETPYSIIKVPLKKFDDIPEARNVTVIKMDCEGAEISILQGMVETISRNRPLIVTEFYEENQRAFGISGDNVYDLVSSFDYSMFTLWFEKLSRDAFLDLHKNGEENFLLLPEELAER